MEERVIGLSVFGETATGGRSRRRASSYGISEGYVVFGKIERIVMNEANPDGSFLDVRKWESTYGRRVVGWTYAQGQAIR
jgi:hypothetical protein